MELTDAHERVLRVLAHGRSNTHHICQQASLDEHAAEEALVTLCAERLAVEVDRNLYEITPPGRGVLDRDYPAEAGFLRESSVIHDAPTIKTLRLRGDRGLVEVQVDEESVLVLADALVEILADTHGETRLSALEDGGAAGED